MAEQTKQGIVVGDRGISRYIYVNKRPEDEPNVRAAWLNADDVATVYVPGGAAQVARCLEWPCVSCQRVSENSPTLESTYILTRQKEKAADGEEREPWKNDMSIVAGERRMDLKKLSAGEVGESSTPLVVLDYHQGWLLANWRGLPNILKARRYLVRTHDPVHVLGGDNMPPEYARLWATIRKQSEAPGVWFSPYQDMANGALKVAGNWETVTENIINYLKRDGAGLWVNGGWRHHVVIQIGNDGALIVSPGSPETILTFPGDQPESFGKRGLGTVVGGGVVITTSIGRLLAEDGPLTHEALVESVGVGLAQARRLMVLGYSDPPDLLGTFIVAEAKDDAGNFAHWTLCMLPDGLGGTCATPEPTTWSAFPPEALAPPKPRELPIEYVPPVGTCDTPDDGAVATDDDDAIKAIIGGTEVALRREIVYSVGKLLTCDPKFANQLICLEDRIKAHVNQKDESVLNIAVLGGPGSGKSFATKQILASAGGNLELVEVNVSQFSEPDQLVEALRKVQTVSLKGNVPLVLWDEFDCVRDGRLGGWLSSFLMPMQDAEFRDGLDTALLGKCVFVFVGSAWETEEKFAGWVEGEGELLKGRDFHSRLDRVLEVPGIGVASEGCPRLMRALLIRLGVKDAGITEIDRNVVDYLLDVEFTHGIRSLNKIIEASQLARTSRFCAHHLPPSEVLWVHMDKIERPTGECADSIKLRWAGDAPVRVGVTGHRYLAELPKLQAAVELALDEIEHAFPNRPLIVVSPLAEGADRLVARTVLDRGGELVVPLPMPLAEYRQDFEAGESQAEFRRLLGEASEVVELPGTRELEDDAYKNVGLYVLDNCDVLIALYDGQPVQGQGGTADVVAQALERGLPVLHIKAGNRKPGTNEPTSLGDEQGDLVMRNI